MGTRQPPARVYLAGPISGMPNGNRTQFDIAAAGLRRRGYEVISPPEWDKGEPAVYNPNDLEPWRECMQRDLRLLTTCDGLALLPGWEFSHGARLERYVALALGRPVDDVGRWLGEFAAEAPQRRPLPPMVALSGYGQVGKDTAAQILSDELGYERRAFADALKRVALRALDTVRPELAGLIRRNGWEAAKAVPGTREFLQVLGTDGLRAEVPDVWVRAALDQPAADGTAGLALSDARFPNEADAVRARGGVVVRIERPGYGPANDHESETALDDYPHDAVVENDAGLDVFRSRLLAAVSDVALMA